MKATSRSIRSGILTATSPTPINPKTPIIKSGKIGAPPTKRTTAAAAMTKAADPKSGCFTNKSTGRSKIRNGKMSPSHASFIFGPFHFTHAAAKSTVANFNISPGCTAKGPKGIHRADPLTDLPSPGTREIATKSVANPKIQPAKRNKVFASQRLNPTHIPVPTASQSPCLWRK